MEHEHRLKIVARERNLFGDYIKSPNLESFNLSLNLSVQFFDSLRTQNKVRVLFFKLRKIFLRNASAT